MTLQISTYITVQTVKRHMANPHVSNANEEKETNMAATVCRAVAVEGFSSFLL